MKLTITLEHWNKAKDEDNRTGRHGRVNYCPIAQCLMGMGYPNVKVLGDWDYEGKQCYTAQYGTTTGKVTGCGVEVAKTFDNEKPLPPDLLPCTFELPDPS